MRARGFSLVELLVALAFVGILATAFTGILLSQSRLFGRNEALSEARAGPTAAVNLMASELRMVETGGGVVAVGADSLRLRLPYALGVVCAGGGGATTAALMPVDSAVYAGIGYDDYAWQAAGVYSYVATTTPPAAGAASDCTSAGIEAVPGGSVVTLAPAAPAPAGAPLFLYRTVTYRFAPSRLLPGRRALWRATLDPDSAEEVAMPFDSTARFRFFARGSRTAADAPPVPLSDLAGVQLVLTGAAIRPSAGGTGGGYLAAPLSTAVFFVNHP